MKRPGTRTSVVIGTGAAVAALVAALIAVPGPEGSRVTVYFDHAVGVYAGSDLRVLGVKVGTVDAVRPEGERVRVQLTLDHGVKVPADASAVVVAPSVVADRYIQLTPAWTGGPLLTDRAVIPADRTAEPVEIDQLYQSLTDLSTALGPDGANATGALSRLLDTGARNMGGNGRAIGDSIEQLGRMAKTLSGHSDDLFDTLTQLQAFTTMLRENDTQVRSATDRLADVNTFLAEDKEELGLALQNLAVALGEVKTFVEQNRTRLAASIDQLVPITQSLVDQRASLAELLDTAPLAAGNLLRAYDPARGTLAGRANLTEIAELPLPLPGVGR
ncbi:MCE family protein [Kitasatospora sp. NPDC002040]|uniref:MCE family protein n=1 Tax=Kitasatospora sp. NPDC002040 TaxID=3154661 RepID=UPI003323631B